MCQWSAFKSDADAKPNFLFDDETVNLVTGINYVSTRAALVDLPHRHLIVWALGRFATK
jgi:hypothetical protein